jgi:pimeloyl-ACP methyl ester carboxylesterase
MKKPQLRVILVHGMGRTPLAMLPLAARLRAQGFRPALFGYVPAFERWDGCVNRLKKFIEKHTSTKPFILVGHSLGTVLIRAVLPRLTRKPSACFFLAPPTRACRAARRFAPHFVYRIFFGQMGQRLADPAFMDALPMPDIPVKIYAGTGGPVGRFSPFGEEPNDGVLAVQETLLPDVPVQTVPALHTFIMNSKWIARDIVETTNVIRQDSSQKSEFRRQNEEI